MIPIQLQKIGFRFCKLGWKLDPKKIRGKIPLENDWQNTNNYAWNDSELQEWLNAGNNIGVCTGYKMLLVPDIDSQEEYERIKDQLPNTFTVKSGGRGLPHYYYFLRDIDEVPNRKVGKVDLRGLGGQVVCAGSKLKNEKNEVIGEYTILNDAPIADISWNLIKKIFNITEDNQKVDVKNILGGVEEGTRNNELFRLACSLVAKGVTKNDVLAMMERANDKTTPKLTIVELVQIRDSAWKYHKQQENNYIKKDKTDEKPIKEASFIEDEVHIYEQCHDNGKNFFARYNKQKQTVDYVESIEKEDFIFKPIDGEEIQKRVILLPTKAEEYGTDKDLDAAIEKHLKEWLDIDETYRKFTVWNIRFSWLYDKFNTLNYTRALGDTGTGKSRFLDTIGNICYKPMRVAGALTPAVIFRIIDKWKGTLCIDEGDQTKSEETDAFIKIMNCGYEKGRAVSRVDKDHNNKINFFDVYCPKVITTRKRFDDKATEARCMTKIMTQTNRKDIKVILTTQYEIDSQRLRNKLLMYRFRNYNLINPELGLEIDMSEFEPRLQQVNVGFMGLFSTNPESLLEFKEYLRGYQTQIIEERSDSPDGGIVQSIADLIIDGHENINPTMITEHCNIHYRDVYEAHVRSVGRKMKSMGLTSVVKKVNGKTERVLNLKDVDMLSNLFSRYIFDFDKKNQLILKGYQVTSATSVTSTSSEQISDTSDDQKGYNVTSVTSAIDTRPRRNQPLEAAETTEVTSRVCIPMQCNRRNFVTVTEPILMPCKICGAPPPCNFVNQKNQPICEMCKVNIEEGIIVAIEDVVTDKEPIVTEK